MKLFNEKLIAVRNDINNWKDAVKAGVQLLEQNGYANLELYDAIIENTRLYSAYYVISNSIAFLHANPSSNNIKDGSSVVILDKPIIFNNEDDKKARIIVTISAVDEKSHMEYISEFGKIFRNKQLLNEINKVSSADEFYSALNDYAVLD